MYKKTFFVLVFLSVLRVSSIAQLMVTSSGEMYVGSFVQGALYSIDPPFNEITFTIFDNIDINKEYKVKLYFNNSDNGTESDAKIITEWVDNINTPFINGAEFIFTGRLVVKVQIKNIQLSSDKLNVERFNFKQQLDVFEIR